MATCWECARPIGPSEPRKSWLEENDHTGAFEEVHAHVDCDAAMLALASRVLLPALRLARVMVAVTEKEARVA